MKKLQIFESAMCCPTGVCGPSVDPELLRLTSVLINLKNNGIIIDRYNLTSNPQKFIDITSINELINDDGIDSLPAVMLDGEIIIKGRYPTNQEIAKYLDVPLEKLEAPKSFGFNMSK